MRYSSLTRVTPPHRELSTILVLLSSLQVQHFPVWENFKRRKILVFTRQTPWSGKPIVAQVEPQQRYQYRLQAATYHRSQEGCSQPVVILIHLLNTPYRGGRTLPSSLASQYLELRSQDALVRPSLSQSTKRTTKQEHSSRDIE
jgi:hypothetical protein